MFDRKTIRRRRAVLVAFVAAAMVLITVSFGGGGPLGAIQDGAQDVVSPIENGANRALKPVRDLVGWVGDTFDAKGDNEKLRDEVAGPAQGARRPRDRAPRRRSAARPGGPAAHRRLP